MNPHGVSAKLIFLSSLVFLAAVLSNCTKDQLRPESAEGEMKSVRAEEKQTQKTITQLELQSELMGYADSFATILSQGFEDFDALQPTPRQRYVVLGDFVYATAAAFTIAGGPNPEVALLDMIVMVTLGRMIYEEEYLQEFGDSVEVMLKRYRQLEEEIWQIGEKVMAPEQQQELRDLIRNWRADNPRLLLFTHLRFGDFAAQRQKSTLATAAETGRVFKSVAEATQEVEKTRLLAERGIFLGTRLPLLAGSFTDVWVSQWGFNPSVKQVLEDVHTFSLTSKQMATVAEKLPGQIAEERQNLVQDLASQEKALRGLLGEARQAMAQGTELIALINETTRSVDKTVAQIGSVMSIQDEGRPFDITEYHAAVLAAQDTAQKTESLLKTFQEVMQSPEREGENPLIVKIVGQLTSESEGILIHASILAAILILFFFAALFAYRYFSRRAFGPH